MNIVFDFDGTIAKSTPYHRVAWTLLLKTMGLDYELDQLLPYEGSLKERFDSYRRIKAGFLYKDTRIKERVSSYFQIQDEDHLVRKIMDFKESLTVSGILKESLPDTLNNLGINLIPSLHYLKTHKAELGIISSTRETIISSFLYKCDALDLFDFIIGEESLTNSDGILLDKPDPYAKTILNNRKKAMDYYIGDNHTIDLEFANACGANFIYADYKADFLVLVEKIISQL